MAKPTRHSRRLHAEMKTRNMAYIRDNLNKLLQQINLHRFLCLTGIAESGKTTFIQTGVIPALERSEGGQAAQLWRIAAMRPGTAPFRNMAQALLAETALGKEAQAGVEDVEAFLCSDAQSLIQALREAGLPQEAKLILIIDQFEELFQETYLQQAEEINKFIALLVASVNEEDLPFALLVSLRTESLATCRRFPKFWKLIQQSELHLSPLTREQQEQVIEGGQVVLNEAPQSQEAGRQTAPRKAPSPKKHALRRSNIALIFLFLLMSAVAGLMGWKWYQTDSRLRQLGAQHHQLTEQHTTIKTKLKQAEEKASAQSATDESFQLEQIQVSDRAGAIIPAVQGVYYIEAHEAVRIEVLLAPRLAENVQVEYWTQQGTIQATPSALKAEYIASDESGSDEVRVFIFQAQAGQDRSGTDDIARFEHVIVKTIQFKVF